MNRNRRHRIKQERPETSSSRRETEHDLAYYIHDRVELVHQVFTVLKAKDLKAMAPECVRHISIKDLQELCTEELLGISSKRLLSILDGAAPPSDTESSSASPELETISLDSISSDEEILSQGSKKKKRKHRRSKSKRKRSPPPPDAPGAAGDVSRASRAGLTVLELLELQARARAIRAQLYQENSNKAATDTGRAPRAPRGSRGSRDSSDAEVQIKEEPPEVVTISSGDEEKPAARRLLAALQPSTSKEPEQEPEAPPPPPPAHTQTNTKKVNDLTITVPQTKQTRKIKLNRNKVTVSVPNDTETNAETVRTVTEASEDKNEKKKKAEKNKEKGKKKKKAKKNNTDKDNSDHDEITLQLSDSEKMDLLEDFDRKNYDVVTSSSEDSESSSEDSDADVTKNGEAKTNSNVKSTVTIVNDKTAEVSNGNSGESGLLKEMSLNDDQISSKDKAFTLKDVSLDNIVADSAVLEVNDLAVDDKTDKNDTKIDDTNVTDIEAKSNENKVENEATNVEASIVISSVDDIPVVQESTTDNTEVVLETLEQSPSSEKAHVTIDMDNNQPYVTQDRDEITLEKVSDSVKDNVEVTSKETESGKESEKSEGEMSDRESSEVEACDLRPEVVCISDDEATTKKKKKKKEKKSKKSKKSKKKDFREASDQNFYKDSGTIEETPIDLNSGDDVYEILEILSDDSSCYEVEGTVLSKEPTAEEIEALSAKIDEIEKQEVGNKQALDNEGSRDQVRDIQSESSEEIENISWKDRYLESKKVKRVLSTANILNALRKKNKELKKKMEESKKAELVETETTVVEEKEIKKSLEEGSIEHYNTLEGSTKFVDPAKETEVEKPETENDNVEENGGKLEIEPIQVTGEMKKDAKQLLKMYKRLLKQYKGKGDVVTTDLNKKKKKKKKSKDKKNAAGVANT